MGSLGDTLVALPALRFIRSNFPDARITILTNEPVSGKATPLSALLEGTGLCDDFLNYSVGIRNVTTLLDLRKSLLRADYELMFWLNAARGVGRSFRDLLFFKTCGIRKILGIPFHRNELWPQQLPDSPLYEPESARLLRRIGGKSQLNLDEDQWWDLAIHPREEATAAEILNSAGIKTPFVAASIGTKVSSNDWGDENWSALLQQICRKYPDFPVVFIGAPGEKERSCMLARLCNNAVNLCGACSPRVTAALLRKAILFIGHDSGPMHLAATVGTRCVSIFSARNPPGRWFPRGKENINLYPTGFFKWKAIADMDYQKRAIYSIAVKDVFDSVCRLLDPVS